MDLLELYIKYVKNLKKGSGNQWRGNCPFHQEKTKKNKPFCVNMKTGLYHCKGCSAKGNATTFAKNISERIYDYNNKTNIGGYQKFEIKNIASYYKELSDNPENMPRFWNTDIIKLLEVGWDSTKNNYVFPIFNKKNEIINVKHHHGAQFNGASARLYPLNIVNDYDEPIIVITEGEKDVVSSISKGIPAVTSTGGATVVPEDISELMRFNKIFICFDNDPAGDAGIDLWIKKIKEQDPKKYIRVCDLSNYVDEGGDVTDYFSVEGKSQQTFYNEIIDKSVWARLPGTDVPTYIKQILLSDKITNLSFRDQNVLFHLVHRAARYTFKTSEINGLRVRMRPGEFITSYERFAKLCGKDMTAKMVIGATDKLVSLKLIHKENLKMKRGMKFTLNGWIDEHGHSESHSENKKVGIQNIKFLSSEELISKLKNGHSE